MLWCMFLARRPLWPQSLLESLLHSLPSLISREQKWSLEGGRWGGQSEKFQNGSISVWCRSASTASGWDWGCGVNLMDLLWAILADAPWCCHPWAGQSGGEKTHLARREGGRIVPKLDEVAGKLGHKAVYWAPVGSKSSPTHPGRRTLGKRCMNLAAFLEATRELEYAFCPASKWLQTFASASRILWQCHSWHTLSCFGKSYSGLLPAWTLHERGKSNDLSMFCGTCPHSKATFWEVHGNGD